MTFDELTAPTALLLASDPDDYISLADAVYAFEHLGLPAGPTHNALAGALLADALTAGLIVAGDITDTFTPALLDAATAAARVVQAATMALPYQPGSSNDDTSPGLYAGAVGWFDRTPLGKSVTGFVSQHTDLLGRGLLRPLPAGALQLDPTGWPVALSIGASCRIQAQCPVVWIDPTNRATTLACDLRGSSAAFAALIDGARVDAVHVQEDSLFLRTDRGMLVLKPRPDTLTHWIATIDDAVAGAAFASWAPSADPAAQSPT